MDQKNLSLFDLMDIEDAKARPEECKHFHEEKTETFWKDIQEWRMTWTCVACGRIRGRV